MIYPKGQIPLHVPHCRQVRIRSPSSRAYRLFRKVLLNVVLNGESVLSKVHLRITDMDTSRLLTSGTDALFYIYRGKELPLNYLTKYNIVAFFTQSQR